MKTFRIPLIISILLLLGLPTFGQSSPSVVPVSSQPLGNLLMTKLSTNASGSNGCFFGTIAMNVTWTQSNQTYTVTLVNFAVVIILPNQQIGNSTLTSYISPTNAIRQVTLYPYLPVTLVLSFVNVCTSSASNLRLYYIDNNFSFKFNLP